MTNKFQPCAIVPSYNHSTVISQVVAGLQGQELTVIIIDDGSSEPTKSILSNLHDPESGVIVDILPRNLGKGGAVLHGIRLAAQKGYSHAVQVDADGQHDISALPKLIGLSQKHPQALISGKPVYDMTIPRSRKIARWLTHVWVWVETLSFQITDSMCGYRVYPIASTLSVADSEHIGQRMDFDTEIMVRLFWRGVATITTPVRVTYPAGNTSNFHMISDNWRITKMHTRLVFGMIFNLPTILKNRPQNPEAVTHWSSIDERGMEWGLKLLAAIYRALGKKLCLFIMQPVLLYFFITGTQQRKASNDYWLRIYREAGFDKPVTLATQYSHFRSFGNMALDKFAVWMGDITPDDLILPEDGEFDRVCESGKGILVIASHLGNVEISRALARQRHRALKITVFAHTEHAVKFNRVLSNYNPEAAIEVVQVNDMTPATAIDLEDRINRGEWVVIAGDRIPIEGQKRLCDIQFLGDNALFSEGPIIIGALLKCPVYMLLCMKEKNKYRIVFNKLTDQIKLPHKDKKNAIKFYLQEYTSLLEKNCKAYPEQWYNFFDFWKR